MAAISDGEREFLVVEMLAVLKRLHAEYEEEQEFIFACCEERHGVGSYKRPATLDEAAAFIARVESL